MINPTNLPFMGVSGGAAILTSADDNDSNPSEPKTNLENKEHESEYIFEPLFNSYMPTVSKPTIPQQYLSGDEPILTISEMNEANADLEEGGMKAEYLDSSFNSYLPTVSMPTVSMPTVPMPTFSMPTIPQGTSMIKKLIIVTVVGGIYYFTKTSGDDSRQLPHPDDECTNVDNNKDTCDSVDDHRCVKTDGPNVCRAPCEKIDKKTTKKIGCACTTGSLPEFCGLGDVCTTGSGCP